MKILWIADSPTLPTGYGNASRWICTGLADRGHNVSILGWGYKQGPTPWHNCMLYPCGSSADELLPYLHQFQPDVVVALTDIWMLTKYVVNPPISNFMDTAGIPWVLYYPVDSNISENRLPSSWVHILKHVDVPIAMGCYGRDITQANGIKATHIPLGIDTKVFQPPENKLLAKQMFEYEGKFVVLSDARNTPRKMLPRTLEIFQRFAADKDDVILHLHCDPDDPWTRFPPEYCYDLRSDIAFLKLTDKVRITKDMSISKGLPIEQLAKIYQAADVHLLASWGEGFGMPTLQAAATGVVPLASDYTASRDLVLGHGEAIRVSHFLVDQLGLRRALIDIEDAVNKLENLYQDRQLLASKAQMAREFALSYDWKCIIPQWDELLSQRRISRHSSVHTSDNSYDFQGEKDSSNLERGKSKVSEADFIQEDIQPERILRIPVTLPLVKSKQRISGYVYVASQCDVPSVLALRRIFPGLKVWSTVSLDFGLNASNEEPLQAKIVEANSTEYRAHLALSTLALDMSSFDLRLPVEAAKLGVPCIGLAQQREQAQLWPQLSLEKPDPMMVAKLGRQMLTDQGVATDLCLGARQLLAGALVESKLELH